MGCDQKEAGAFKNGTSLGAKIIPQVEGSNNGSQLTIEDPFAKMAPTPKIMAPVLFSVYNVEA